MAEETDRNPDDLPASGPSSSEEDAIHSLDDLSSGGLLQEILENTPDLISIASVNGRVIYANRSAIEKLGKPQSVPENEAGSGGLPSGHPLWDDPVVREEGLPVAMKDGTWRGETVLSAPDGEPIPVSQVILAHRAAGGEVTHLSTIARDIRVLEHVRRDRRWQMVRAELRAALSQKVAEAGLDYGAVLEAVTRHIAHALDGGACTIYLAGEPGGELEPAAVYRSESNGGEGAHDVECETGDWFQEQARRVYRSGEAVRDSEARVAIGTSGLPCSFLIVPLRTQGRNLGALSVVNWAERNRYTEEDRRFLQDLADRAALAIENARLYLAEARRARELDALHTATAALLSTLDLESLLGEILDAATSAIPTAERGLLHLIAAETGELQVRAVHGYSDPRIQELPLSQLTGATSPAVIEAVEQRKARLVDDREGLPEAGKGGELLGLGAVRSEIVAPLILNQIVQGAISLQSSRPNAFRESDLRLLTSFAVTTMTALQNARLHAEVQKLALTDPLTGCYNRRGFFEFGRHQIEQARRSLRPLSLVMVDLDHFKEVNDRYGHATGDEGLKILADRMHGCVREADVLARFGGDEFVILLPNASLFAAHAVAERVRARLEEPLVLRVAITPGEIEEVQFSITGSLGVTRATQFDIFNEGGLDRMIQRADEAAYRAKRTGRNRVEMG